MDRPISKHHSTFECSLCPKKSNPRGLCCCKAFRSDVVLVIEEKLMEKFNIHKGDYVCKMHFSRMNSTFLTSSRGSNCSSPFHVGSTVGKRIRPVPRAWRHYFEGSDAVSRYMPSLQLCEDCYKITLNLLLDANHDSDAMEVSSTYTSPKSVKSRGQWRSNASYMSPNSSGSESSWSVTSATPIRPKTGMSSLMSLYINRRQEHTSSSRMPDSIKRYLRSNTPASSSFDLDDGEEFEVIKSSEIEEVNNNKPDETPREELNTSSDVTVDKNTSHESSGGTLSDMHASMSSSKSVMSQVKTKCEVLLDDILAVALEPGEEGADDALTDVFIPDQVKVEPKLEQLETLGGEAAVEDEKLPAADEEDENKSISSQEEIVTDEMIEVEAIGEKLENADDEVEDVEEKKLVEEEVVIAQTRVKLEENQFYDEDEAEDEQSEKEEKEDSYCELQANKDEHISDDSSEQLEENEQNQSEEKKNLSTTDESQSEQQVPNKTSKKGDLATKLALETITFMMRRFCHGHVMNEEKIQSFTERLKLNIIQSLLNGRGEAPPSGELPSSIISSSLLTETMKDLLANKLKSVRICAACREAIMQQSVAMVTQAHAQVERVLSQALGLLQKNRSSIWPDLEQTAQSLVNQTLSTTFSKILCKSLTTPQTPTEVTMHQNWKMPPLQNTLAFHVDKSNSDKSVIKDLELFYLVPLNRSRSQSDMRSLEAMNELETTPYRSVSSESFFTLAYEVGEIDKKSGRMEDIKEIVTTEDKRDRVKSVHFKQISAEVTNNNETEDDVFCEDQSNQEDALDRDSQSGNSEFDSCDDEDNDVKPNQLTEFYSVASHSDLEEEEESKSEKDPEELEDQKEIEEEDQKSLDQEHEDQGKLEEQEREDREESEEREVDDQKDVEEKSEANDSDDNSEDKMTLYSTKEDPEEEDDKTTLYSTKEEQDEDEEEKIDEEKEEKIKYSEPKENEERDEITEQVKREVFGDPNKKRRVGRLQQQESTFGDFYDPEQDRSVLFSRTAKLMKNASTFNVLRQRRSRTKLPLGTGEPEEIDVAEVLGEIVEKHTPDVWPLRIRRKHIIPNPETIYKRTDARTKTSLVLFILIFTLSLVTFLFYAGWRAFVGNRIY